MMKPAKSSTLCIRVTDDLKNRLDTASASMPYRPTLTSIAERGFELALAELEQIASRLSEKNQ